ncbi:hypothetical protein [Agromyces laixinhei]|nr:hypothetical protein [Agromyces laixinhei]
MLVEDEVVIPDAVWVGFVRIVTNRAVFEVLASFDRDFRRFDDLEIVVPA